MLRLYEMLVEKPESSKYDNLILVVTRCNTDIGMKNLKKGTDAFTIDILDSFKEIFPSTSAKLRQIILCGQDAKTNRNAFKPFCQKSSSFVAITKAVLKGGAEALGVLNMVGKAVIGDDYVEVKACFDSNCLLLLDSGRKIKCRDVVVGDSIFDGEKFTEVL